MATHLQGVLDVDKRHGFGGLALSAVTHQEVTKRTWLGSVMAWLKLGQERRDHCVFHEATLSGLQGCLRSEDL
jgi:hypothetical protein